MSEEVLLKGTAGKMHRPVRGDRDVPLCHRVDAEELRRVERHLVESHHEECAICYAEYGHDVETVESE